MDGLETVLRSQLLQATHNTLEALFGSEEHHMQPGLLQARREVEELRLRTINDVDASTVNPIGRPGHRLKTCERQITIEAHGCPEVASARIVA
jgi:hypothetical protein